MIQIIRPVFCLLVLLGTVTSAWAEDVYRETLIKLETPKKDSKRSREGGQEHVAFRIWLPEDVKTVRGVVLNPFYTKAVTQEHWQAACRGWGFGIVATNFFGARKDEFPQRIDEALKVFAQETSHPELIDAKFCLVGMSAGAGMCVNIAQQMPSRTIAVGPVCLEVGPRDPASMNIPMLTVFGERDGRQYEKLMSKLPEVRSQSGQFGIAVQWRRRHEFGQANNLLFPLFDAAIGHRLTEPGKPLRDFEEENGWLGDLSVWSDRVATVAPYQQYQGKKTAACWFPNETIARAWQAFVVQKPMLQLKSPAGLGDGQPFVVHRPGDSITVVGKWKSQSPPPEKIEVFAGAKGMGTLESGTLEIQFDQPGIYPIYLRAEGDDGTVFLSRPNTVVVRE